MWSDSGANTMTIMAEAEYPYDPGLGAKAQSLSPTTMITAIE